MALPDSSTRKRSVERRPYQEGFSRRSSPSPQPRAVTHVPALFLNPTYSERKSATSAMVGLLKGALVKDDRVKEVVTQRTTPRRNISPHDRSLTNFDLTSAATINSYHRPATTTPRRSTSNHREKTSKDFALSPPATTKSYHKQATPPAATTPRRSTSNHREKTSNDCVLSPPVTTNSYHKQATPPATTNSYITKGNFRKVAHRATTRETRYRPESDRGVILLSKGLGVPAPNPGGANVRRAQTHGGEV